MTGTVGQIFKGKNTKSSVSSDSTLRHVLEYMRAKNIGVMAATRDKRIVGVFTTRDIRQRVVLEPLDLDAVLLETTMSSSDDMTENGTIHPEKTAPGGLVSSVREAGQLQPIPSGGSDVELQTFVLDYHRRTKQRRGGPVDARQANKRASDGPAAKEAPAELHVANDALAKADQSNDADSDSYMTRDLAYVARRKALLTEATASIILDKKSQSTARDDYEETQSAMVEETQKDLNATKEKLADSEHSGNLTAAQQLAAEKKARADAGNALLPPRQHWPS